MTKKSVITLWTITAALGIGVAVLSSNKADSGKANTARARGETLLATFPAIDVAKLIVKTADSNVTVEKKDGNWLVAERENYPAKASNINTLLRAIEEVKINNAIEAGPTYAKRFGVDPASTVDTEHGTNITMSDAAGKVIANLVLGKDSEGGGRFVRNVADETGVYVTSESFPTATAQAKDWLNDEFIKVEKITSIQISPAGKPEDTEWTLSRADENAEFTMSGLSAGETINTSNTAALKSLLSVARFQDVLPNAKRADHEKAADLRKLTIGTKDGFTYAITLSAKPKEATPPAIAKPEDTPPPAEEEAFFMTVEVAATINEKREKAADEKPEDTKAKDEAFQASVKALQEKLKTEQAYQGKLYEVSKYVIDSVLKPQSDFITAPAPQEATPAPFPTPQPQQQPQQEQPQPNPGRIEAVTPPVSIGPEDAPEE